MRKYNIIENAADIVDYLNSNELIFTPRDQGQMIFLNAFGASVFSSLEDSNIPDDLRNLILQNFPEEETIPISFIQIQRYQPGEYILPHKDNYLTQLRLFQLTSSEYSGLTVQEKDRYKFYHDVAGSEILFDRSAWHWVNPVRDLRYTMVIGYH